MISHLFYYQLALLTILWLFVMLPVTWSEPGLTTPAVPAKPKRKRSTEPQPFAGLTAGLKDFLDYALAKGAVWFAKRIDIAHWWLEHHEEFTR
jgi:hypothetical protein